MISREPPPPIDPVALFAGTSLEVRTVPWRSEVDAGHAWLVGMPRSSARLEVRPSAHVVPFDELLPNDDGPWVAINGGFYDADAPMGLVVHSGTVHAPFRRGGGSGVLVGLPDGSVAIKHRNDELPAAAEAVQSIDRLIAEGRSLVQPQPDAPRAARSAVALTDDRVWIVLAASDSSVLLDDDGQLALRATSGRGLALSAFADLLLSETGAKEALNLDGAVSSQLAVRDHDRRFEIRGELGTIDAIVFR